LTRDEKQDHTVATTPRAIAHSGSAVPDIEAAIAWYEKVLGMRPIGPPAEVDLTDDSHFARLCIDIFGSNCKRLKLAHLSTANGTALELFEFVDPATEIPDDNFRYWRQGIFHLCVVGPDVPGLAGRIEVAGGKVRSQIWDLFEGQPYQLVYCEDPFRTVVEIYSHSHEQFFANQG
jgi:catechol 2,3-dioxygenase-like lactoylglutathione lyase family enzyme